MFQNLIVDKSKIIYIQIYNYIKDMILKGVLTKKSKLLSTREMADTLNVSRTSVMKAYKKLEDDGFVYTIEDKGTFVCSVNVVRKDKFNILWSDRTNKYSKMAESLDIIKTEAPWKKGMISFKSIAPDEKLFDTDEVKRSFLNVISLEGNKILNYGYAQGYKYLIQYLFSYMESKGIDIDGKDILVTNGFTEGFDIVVSSLTNKGDSVLCENPTHNTAIKIMKMRNLNLIGIDMDSDGINLDKMEKGLKDNNIKLGYIIPSYHNPTGIVMSYEKRRSVYELFRKYNVPFIEDGFNEELLFESSHIAPIAAFGGNGIVYIGSFSKILFPGIRIGWIMADKSLISTLESVKRSRNIHTSFLDQALLYDYLSKGSFKKYIKRARKYYRDKYEFCIKCACRYFNRKSIIGSGGLHIFVKLDGVNSRELLDKCLSKNVIFTPGDIFYTDGSGKDTLRLGFSRLGFDDIEKGIDIIGKEYIKIKKSN